MLPSVFVMPRIMTAPSSKTLPRTVPFMLCSSQGLLLKIPFFSASGTAEWQAFPCRSTAAKRYLICCRYSNLSIFNFTAETEDFSVQLIFLWMPESGRLFSARMEREDLFCSDFLPGEGEIFQVEAKYTFGGRGGSQRFSVKFSLFLKSLEFLRASRLHKIFS